MFCFSERESWQKERESFTELKSKLEEQKEVDAVKIKEYSVRVFIGICYKGFLITFDMTRFKGIVKKNLLFETCI